MSQNNDIFYINWEGEWLKVKYLREKSDLSDLFEFMEDFKDLKRYIHVKKGLQLTMDYGCMNKELNEGRLLPQKDINNDILLKKPKK